MGKCTDETPLFIPFLVCQRLFDIANIVLFSIELSIKQNMHPHLNFDISTQTPHHGNQATSLNYINNKYLNIMNGNGLVL